MKELNQYILEKFKVNSNSAKNTIYYINDDFSIDPKEDYYTVKVDNVTTEREKGYDKIFDRSHIIYEYQKDRWYKRIIYLYSKKDLKRVYDKTPDIGTYYAAIFDDKFKTKVNDIIAGKIPMKDYYPEETIENRDACLYEPIKNIIKDL